MDHIKFNQIVNKISLNQMPLLLLVVHFKNTMPSVQLVNVQHNMIKDNNLF